MPGAEDQTKTEDSFDRINRMNRISKTEAHGLSSILLIL
jgi:hypothetical protein